jgi:hypothetical protein
MKRGVRPVAHPCDEAKLERVDVAVFDVAPIVGLVADQVLPEPPLPDAAFVACDADGAEPLLLRQRPREPLLISRQRVEKSLSPGGSCQIACK